MLCRRLEGKECLGELGRELCLCSGSYCNLFLPALREPQPQLQYWHALFLLALILLVLLALAATVFYALRRHKSGRYNFHPKAQENSPRLLMLKRRAEGGGSPRREMVVINMEKSSDAESDFDLSLLFS